MEEPNQMSDQNSSSGEPASSMQVESQSEQSQFATASSTPSGAPASVVLPSFGSLFKDTFDFYRNHLPGLLGVMAVPFVVAVLQAMVGINPILWLLSMIVSYLAIISLTYLICREGVGVGESYGKGLKLFFPFIWVAIISGLASLGGFVLLVIPGIFVGIMFSLTSFALVAEDKRGMSALIRSWHLVRGNWLDVFGRLVGFNLLLYIASAAVLFILGMAMPSTGVLGMVSAIIGNMISYLILVPLTMIFVYLLYKSLNSMKSADVPALVYKNAKTTIITFSLIGLVGIVAFLGISGYGLMQLLNGSMGL